MFGSGGERETKLAPRPRVLARQQDVHVARCALGLTIYTRHRLPEPSSGVASLLGVFLECAPLDHLSLFRTSLMDSWKRIRPGELTAVVEDLANRAMSTRARHLFSMHLVDNQHAPEAFFHYREVDEARGAGSGYVQLGFPVGIPPETLFQVAMEAAHRTPMWCGTGGFIASAHPIEKCTSFSAFWTWAKRYWGVDVQDPERARHHVHAGIPSVNWLNLVGTELLARSSLDEAAFRSAARRENLDLIDAPQATVVRAGTAPTLGDMNQMDLALEYRRANQLLLPLVLPDPVRLFGRFWEDDESARWTRRFLEPEGWT